jgi:phosphomannomutase
MAEQWRTVDPDPATRAEIAALLDSGDATALDELFGGAVAFGTAGLRAPMGPGPNRMNRVVVRRATVGLLRQLVPGATVVIGHDVRRNSAVFANDAARVVAAHGGRALVLPAHSPTPLVSFAVRHLGADAGVMCTASHNPPDDNGYKVYLSDGAQVIPPIDGRIVDAIMGVTGVVEVADPDHPAIEHLDAAVEDAYIGHVVALATSRRIGRSSPLRIVYSPLHGVGAHTTMASFARAGFDDVHIVAEQAAPDPAFPTATSPNPERADALRLARADAEALDADVALVHDPDADRLGVLVPDRDGWRALNGNQIGLLLADHTLRRSEGDERLVVDTVVSASALARLAASRGVHHERTLTGFKWIVRAADRDPSRRFVFGYEEALGYSVDRGVRDKDGISAALAMASLVDELHAQRRTVLDRLRELAVEIGLSATACWTKPLPPTVEPEAVVRRLRADPPCHLGGFDVVGIEDYAEPTDLPPTELLIFELEPRSRLAIRPSGTEATLKVYAEVVAHVDRVADCDDVERHASERLDQLHDAVMPILDALVQSDHDARD